MRKKKSHKKGDSIKENMCVGRSRVVHSNTHASNESNSSSYIFIRIVVSYIYVILCHSSFIYAHTSDLEIIIFENTARMQKWLYNNPYIIVRCTAWVMCGRLHIYRASHNIYYYLIVSNNNESIWPRFETNLNFILFYSKEE